MNSCRCLQHWVEVFIFNKTFDISLLGFYKNDKEVSLVDHVRHDFHFLTLFFIHTCNEYWPSCLIKHEFLSVPLEQAVSRLSRSMMLHIFIHSGKGVSFSESKHSNIHLHFSMWSAMVLWSHTLAFNYPVKRYQSSRPVCSEWVSVNRSLWSSTSATSRNKHLYLFRRKERAIFSH